MARRRHVIYSPEFRTWVEASRPKPEVPLTDDARTELRRLRKENCELKMEREILKSDASLEVELVLAALHVALARRPSPPLHHSDRGSQYASDA